MRLRRASKVEKLSIIVSVYNERDGIRAFYKTADEVMKGLSERFSCELIFVNDGSNDGSCDILKEFVEGDREHVRLIDFSKNFGHEAAMTAGLDYAAGDILVFLDADLQHPPTLIPDIIRSMDAGADIVNMVRTKNKTAGLIKNITSGGFYALINRVSDIRLEPSASDFFAIRSNVADVLRKSYREKVRFLRGYVQNVGFNKATISFEAPERVAGKSHYSIKKLFRFSIDTILCFSNMPLKLGIYAGLFSGFLGVLLIIYTLFTRQGAPSGYATIIIVLCFMFAMLFLILGIIGEYIAILFAELKDRPIYIIKDISGGCCDTVDSEADKTGIKNNTNRKRS